MTKVSEPTPSSGSNPFAGPIVFFGNERIATGVTTTVPVLRSLIDAGYQIAAVVSNYERGKSRDVRDLEIAAIAEQHQIPLLLPNKLSDIAGQLSEMGAAAGVLVAYGKIIPESLIDIFPRGIINIHPSLLPKHRGPTPIESVILDGSNKTGVSLMALAKAMDAGAIYAQSEVALSGTETKQQLAEQLLEIGSAMLLETLPGILAGDIVSMPQDESVATYDRLITKEDGLLNFSKPAVQLEREVRAYLEWPKSRTTLGNTDVVITKAHVVPGQGEPGMLYQNGKELGFYTTDDIFVINTLKPAGKQEMTAEAFLNGYGKNLLI